MRVLLEEHGDLGLRALLLRDFEHERNERVGMWYREQVTRGRHPPLSSPAVRMHWPHALPVATLGGSRLHGRVTDDASWRQCGARVMAGKAEAPPGQAISA